MSKSLRDHRDRPIVAVTGIGIVTSLGIGKTDNWRKLSGGESGLHEITRFPTEGLRTKVAGTIDFIPAEPLCAPALSEEFAMVASEEAIGEAGIGKVGDFPGPLFVAVPPVEVEWPQRIEMAAVSNSETIGYDELIRIATTERFKPYYERFLYRGTTERLAERLGTKGSPIALVDGLRFRCLRDPARRRSDPARRKRRGSVDRYRRLGEYRGAHPFRASVGAIHPERPAARCGKAIFEEPRRVRHGGRRGRARARES